MFFYYNKEKIYGFGKSKNEDLQFALSDRRGKEFADIRVYRIQDDGSKMETHKGIFFEAEKLYEFRKGVDCLIEAYEKKKSQKGIAA